MLGDVLDNAPNVTQKGRLGPGQMVMADLKSGTFKENTQIANEVAAQAPYHEWLKRSMRCALGRGFCPLVAGCRSSCITWQLVSSRALLCWCTLPASVVVPPCIDFSAIASDF